MIRKFLKQNVFFPKDLNWVQHWVNWVGLSTFAFANTGCPLCSGPKLSVWTSHFVFVCHSARELVTRARETLLAELQCKPSVGRQMLLLEELLKREGEYLQTHEGTVGDMIRALYQQASYDKKWSAVRRGAGLLKKLVDSLAPGITTILVNGKAVRSWLLGGQPCFDNWTRLVPARVMDTWGRLLSAKAWVSR